MITGVWPLAIAIFILLSSVPQFVGPGVAGSGQGSAEPQPMTGTLTNDAAELTIEFAPPTAVGLFPDHDENSEVSTSETPVER